MYIELFILDNALMDAIVIRAAGALCGRSASWGRILAFAAGGAAYAVLALNMPALMSLPAKLCVGAALSLALPHESWRDFLCNAACVLLCAFVAGGAGMVISLACGGFGWAGGHAVMSTPVRAAIYTAFACMGLPRAIRRFRAGRCAGENIVPLTVVWRGREFRLLALVDTGSTLCEPVSGIPVAIAHVPELTGTADIPVPAKTATGAATLLAMRPESVRVGAGNAAIELFIARALEPIRGADAIIPAFAMPQTGEAA